MSAGESRVRRAKRPELAGIVDVLWYVAAPGRSGFELGLPAPEAQLIINLDEDRLTAAAADGSGTTACRSTGVAPVVPRAVRLDRSEQRRIAGVVIRPAAIGSVLGGASAGLGLLAGLDDVLGPDNERLGEAARGGRTAEEVLDRLEGALVALVLDHRPPCPVAARAVSLLSSGRPVGALADEIGVSTSTLTRRFTAAVGVRPKQFHRLLRLRRVLRHAASTPDAAWADLAADTGYADQPHLINDFSELTGLTPQQWRTWGDGTLHVPIEQPSPESVTISSNPAIRRSAGLTA